MTGRTLSIGLIVFAAIFGAALWWFQTQAFYETQPEEPAVEIAGESFAVSNYEAIDADTSPLKIRACFTLDPASQTAIGLLPSAEEATPLIAPEWFTCYDGERLTRDLQTGVARAVLAEHDAPRGFDRFVAVYPDGRAFMWRQNNGTFEN